MGDSDFWTEKSLPEIPGGWTTREFHVRDIVLQLTVPRNPDEFLDDEQVIAENRRTDFMPYWPYLWPAAEMAAELAADADWPAHAEVLELGCGWALVGLTMLAKGCQVTMSDLSAEAVELAAYNARRNRFEAYEAMVIDFVHPPMGRNWPIIWASDVLFEARLHRPVLDTIDTLLTSEGAAYIADPGRLLVERFLESVSHRPFEVSACRKSLDERLSPEIGEPQVLRIVRQV